MKPSEKLAKLIKKEGPKVTGNSKKLIEAGIDPTKLSPKIIKKALAKAGVKEGKTTTAKPEKSDKKTKKSKTDKKADPKGEKTDKKSKKNAKVEKKTKPGKAEKKSKKAKSSGDHGQRYFIVGHSAASVIRLLGYKGYSRATCRAAANKFGAKGLSDTTVKCQQYDGTRIKNGKADKKTGKGIYGKLPEIDKKEIAPVLKFCKEYEAKAG